MLQLIVITLPVLVTLFLGGRMVDAAAISSRPANAEPNVVQNASTCTNDISVLFVGFRHGSRSSTILLPNDENNSKWTVGVGQLTPQGMQLHYRNGQMVRQKYKPIFNHYDPSKLSARSSPVDRTLMSASTFLASLAQPLGNQVFRRAFPWQPTALYSVPFLEANVGLKVLGAVSSQVLPSIIARDTETIATLEKASGMKAQANAIMFFLLLDNLVTERYAGFNLPFGLNNKLTPKIQYLKDQFFMAIFSDPDVRCRLAPPILDDLITKTDSRLQNKTSQFIYIWSMHDANVFTVLSILTGYRSQSPQFAATIFFEVRPYNNCQDHEVKLIYRKDIDSVEVEMAINGCGRPCNFNALKAIVEKIKADCHINPNTVPETEHSD